MGDIMGSGITAKHFHLISSIAECRRTVKCMSKFRCLHHNHLIYAKFNWSSFSLPYVTTHRSAKNNSVKNVIISGPSPKPA